MPIADLAPNAANPRKITPARKAQLRKSMEQFGNLSPITWNKTTSRIIGGNQRLEGYRDLGHAEVDVWVVELDEAKEKAAVVALNNHAGEWDNAKLSDMIRDIQTRGEDVALTGFRENELNKLLSEMTATPDSDLFMEDVSGFLPGALALKMDMHFPSDEIHEIPALLPSMCCACPEPITCWAGPDATEASEHYLYNVSTDSVRGMPFEKTVVAFYTNDERFEQAWKEPDLFTGKLLNRKPFAVLSPNFSLWFESAAAKKIFNTYRSRWLGRYFQESGLKVIPDAQFSCQKSFDFCFAGIPKNAPCVSIQIQTGKKTKEEVASKRAGIKEVIDRLKPQSLLLYVGDRFEQMVEGLIPKELHTIVISNRVQKRRAIMEKKGGENQMKDNVKGGGGSGSGGTGGGGVGRPAFPGGGSGGRSGASQRGGR